MYVEARSPSQILFVDWPLNNSTFSDSHEQNTIIFRFSFSFDIFFFFDYYR